eukprot:172179-Chlamydomonas_euryale.AAC.1
MLRHDSQELLEKLSSMPLVVCRKLEPPIAIPVFACKRDAVTGASPVTSDFDLPAGGRAAMFLGPLPDEKLPKDATPGRTLVGGFTTGTQRRGGAGPAPGKLPLTYIVPPPKGEKKAGGGGNGGGGTGGGAGGGDGDKATGGNGGGGSGGRAGGGDGDQATGGKADGGGDDVPALGGAGDTKAGANPARASLDVALRDAKIAFLADLKLDGVPGARGGDGGPSDACQLFESLVAELKVGRVDSCGQLQFKAGRPGHTHLLPSAEPPPPDSPDLLLCAVFISCPTLARDQALAPHPFS